MCTFVDALTCVASHVVAKSLVTSLVHLDVVVRRMQSKVERSEPIYRILWVIKLRAPNRK